MPSNSPGAKRAPSIAMVNIGAAGHINPTLPVAAELVKRGAHVTYFAPNEFKEAITGLGADFVGYESSFGAQPPAPGTPAEVLMASMPGRLTGECLQALPQIEKRLRDLNPDVLVYDKFCLVARLLAKEYKLKAATFLPSYAGNEKWSLQRVFAGNVPPLKDHPALKQFAVDAAQLEQRFGVKLSGLHDLFGHTEPVNICFVAQAFHYEGDSFDDRFTFVGPCIAPRPTAGHWAPAPGERRPLVFVSLGTVFNAWPEFFSMGFAAFDGAPYKVLMAVGKQVDLKKLGKPPANVEVAAHVPQLEVLPHTRVFVTHCGMNSTMESLWYGVPMVAIPQMMEQAATAQRVDALGLGNAFTRETIDAKKLRQAVDRLSEDQAVRARVHAMQEKVRASGGQAKAAERLLAYARA
jgi:MGT family glycosyltransferase